VLLDAQGHEIVRVKQYGFVRVPVEYEPAPPAAPPIAQAADAIATTLVASEE
jgi:hypothetical protein